MVRTRLSGIDHAVGRGEQGINKRSWVEEWENSFERKEQTFQDRNTSITHCTVQEGRVSKKLIQKIYGSAYMLHT